MTSESIESRDMRPTTLDESEETPLEKIQDNRTFGPGVDVLESLLSADDFDEPVTGTWLWRRKRIEIPIRSLTPEEKKVIDRKHTKRFRVGENSQMVHTELDTSEYNAEVVSLCVIEPNFTDPEVRQRIGRKVGIQGITAIEAVRRVFQVPGEIDRLALAIVRLSGYSDEEGEVNALKE